MVHSQTTFPESRLLLGCTFLQYSQLRIKYAEGMAPKQYLGPHANCSCIEVQLGCSTTTFRSKDNRHCSDCIRLCDTVGVQVIQLKDLKKIASLGAGAFGQVFLVKHNTKYYALKCLSKALVVETGLQVGSCLPRRWTNIVVKHALQRKLMIDTS